MTDEHGPDAPQGLHPDLRMDWLPEWKTMPGAQLPEPRLYLPTLAELIDRLTIVQIKRIFIPTHAKSYAIEQGQIEHDIDVVLREKAASGLRVDAEMISAITIIMLANRTIWLSESEARAGGDAQDKLLKFSHSLNGVRSRAKNIVAEKVKERVDLKVDALAASLPEEYGNWRVFDG